MGQNPTEIEMYIDHGYFLAEVKRPTDVEITFPVSDERKHSTLIEYLTITVTCNKLIIYVFTNTRVSQYHYECSFISTSNVTHFRHGKHNM